MTKEQLSQNEPHDVLHYDAHEFDGLRNALDEEAQTLLRKADEFVRGNAWLCAGIAVAAGVALGCLLRKK